MSETTPINKGNYSMDTPERETLFEKHRGEAWPEGYRKYRSDWVEFAENKTVPDYPLLVDLELASVCDLRCPMCYTISDSFKEKVNAKLMDWDLFRKVIDEIGGEVPALRLSLRGEATLHPKFDECIRYAKEKGIGEVSTLTHGRKLKGEFAYKMIDAGIDWITVSIDGVGKTYEDIRRPIAFDEILANLREVDAYKKSKGLNRPVIKIQAIWPSIAEDPKTFYDTFSPISDLVAFNPLIDYLGKDEDIVYLEEFSCPQQYQRLVIGADGLVMKCSNDEENREVIGDLNKETVHQVWHGEAMREVRMMHRMKQGFMQSKVCRDCYLPRKTQDETVSMSGREKKKKNYVNRTQKIGA